MDNVNPSDDLKNIKLWQISSIFRNDSQNSPRTPTQVSGFNRVQKMLSLGILVFLVLCVVINVLKCLF